MSPFDPNFKSDKFTLTARERGHRSAAQKQSKLMQVRLDRQGPTRVPTQAEKAAAAAKTARLVKAAI